MSDLLQEDDLEEDDCQLLALLVDDQPVVAAGLRRMLEGEADINLHYCKNASEAVDLACSMTPTVILQDLFMPETDGLTLVRHYRERLETRDVPIIVLSSEEDAKVKADAFEAGANDYLVKFPGKHELAARIRYHSKWYIHKLQRDENDRIIKESHRQLEALNAQLQAIANLDGLTGVANRRHFNERIDQEWKRAMRHGLPLSLIMLDVDFFKKFNDELGHLLGDDCLKRLASALDEMCRRSTDLFARYGGEEFVALLPDTSLEEASSLAESMRARVEGLQLRHPASGASNYVTISLGVACLTPVQGMPSVEVIHAADKALYHAKEQGRNRVAVEGGKSGQA